MGVAIPNKYKKHKNVRGRDSEQKKIHKKPTGGCDSELNQDAHNSMGVVNQNK